MRLHIKCKELERQRLERAQKMKDDMFKLHLIFKKNQGFSEDEKQKFVELKQELVKNELENKRKSK